MVCLSHDRVNPKTTKFIFTTSPLSINQPQALVARTTPLFSNFLFANLFSIKFLYFLLFHLFFLILTCSCQYSYNFMLTTICMFRPYIDTFVSIFIQSHVNHNLHVSTLYIYISVRMVVDLQLPMQSVPITTNVVSSNLVHSKMYSIQHYVINFVSDLRQVGGFLRVHRFLHK
jgi:hypothetical protein